MKMELDTGLSLEKFVLQMDDLIEARRKEKAKVNLPLKLSQEGASKFFQHFKCQKCGRCCTTPPDDEGDNHIFFSEEEFQQVKNRLPRGWQNKFKKAKDELAGPGYKMLYPCLFYNKKKGGCIIYKTRPFVCRIYPIAIPIPEAPLNLAVNTCPGACKAIKEILIEYRSLIWNEIK